MIQWIFALTGCADRPPEPSLRWDTFEVRVVQTDDLARHLEISDGRRRWRTTESEHLSDIEAIELDQAPPELRYTSHAGAHGNQVVHVLAITAAGPREVLSVGVDEGTLTLEDLDGDGAPEVTGWLTRYFNVKHDFSSLWDFSRPYVLKRVGGSWMEQTPTDRVLREIERIQAQMEREGFCLGGEMVHLYGLSMLIHQEAQMYDRLAAPCELHLPWLNEHTDEIRAELKQPFFDGGSPQEVRPL